MCSELTGNYFNADKLAYVLHKYKALAFFDYSNLWPYFNVNMNGLSEFNDNSSIFQNIQNKMRLAYKDAIFMTMKSFTAGESDTAVVIVKKHLILNQRALQQNDYSQMIPTLK